jgi:SAM-dependent methyltransferase
MKHPGKEWYEGYDNYGGTVFGVSARRKFWNHSQFMLEQLGLGELVDVGCGPGTFLARAQSMGYSVTGIDFDPEAIEQARSVVGDHVYTMSLEDFLEKTNRRYDVVTFFEVLEHMDNPLEFMSTVRRVLKDGGHIALSVPNRYRWMRAINVSNVDFPPHHLTRWDTVSLGNFLRQCGFDIVTLREQPLRGIDSVLVPLLFMMPTRIVWNRLGKWFSRGCSHAGVASPASPLRRLMRGAFVRLMRFLYFAHKVFLYPLAALLLPLLRLGGGRGIILYACAKLRSAPQ